MNEQAIRFRIGIFVLAALILLAVLIMLFGGLPFYFLPSTTYTIQFDNAQGVAAGTPVRRSGVKIGEVRKVSLDNETGKVEVVIQVEDGYRLRKADRPTIVQSIFGGDSSIAFLPPPAGKAVNAGLVEPGEVLEGVALADAGTLVQKTSDVIAPAEEVIKEIKKSFEKIDKMVPVVERTFANVDKLTPGLDNTIKSMGKTSDEIRAFIQKVDDKDVKKALDRFDKLASAMEKVFDKIDKMSPAIEETVKELRDLARTVNKEGVPELKKTAEEIQILSRQWNKVGERVDVLLRTNEDKLIKALERTDEALKRISDVFNDENQRNVRDTLKNVRTASDRFDGIARSTDELLKDGRVTLKSLNESMAKLDRVLTDVRDIVQVMARGDGTIQRLLSDPSLYNNLNEASCGLSKMMPRLNYILRDVQIFADKIARHPEVLGIGGVVRPGSGVKESTMPYKVPVVHP